MNTVVLVDLRQRFHLSLEQRTLECVPRIQRYHHHTLQHTGVELIAEDDTPNEIKTT